MSKPNARDKEVALEAKEATANGMYLEECFAAYREEIEAKKTVPMAMLREIANWEREDWTESLAIESIIARYGYEVTE